MKTFLPANVPLRVLRFIMFIIFGVFLGGCASNPSTTGDVISGVLMGIGMGLSGL